MREIINEYGMMVLAVVLIFIMIAFIPNLSQTLETGIDGLIVNLIGSST